MKLSHILILVGLAFEGLVAYSKHNVSSDATFANVQAQVVNLDAFISDSFFLHIGTIVTAIGLFMLVRKGR